MDIDLALLQEAGKPPRDIVERIEADPVIKVDSAPWKTMIVGSRTRYRTAIVKLSDRISIGWIEAKSLETAEYRELVASWPDTLTAVVVKPPSGEELIAVSMYAPWVRVHSYARSSSIFADGSAHHIASNLSTFIAKKRGHRLLATSTSCLVMASTEIATGPVATKPCSTGWRPWDCPASDRNIRMEGKPTHGRRNYHKTAGMSPPSPLPVQSTTPAISEVRAQPRTEKMSGQRRSRHGMVFRDFHSLETYT